MTRLPTLLTASAVIAASLLGGCSDSATNMAGAAAQAPAPLAAKPVSEVGKTLPAKTADREVGERLASLALDDGRLSEIRGGIDAGSGVVLNFAFQQATFVNHNLTETVVVPTLTITPGQGTTALAGASPLTGFGVASAASIAGGSTSISSATVVANGTVQTQVSASAPLIQALVNSGMATVVGGAGNNGLTSVLTNTQNNALVQQMTTVDIGVTGLSKMLQQSVPSTVQNQLSGPNSFR